MSNKKIMEFDLDGTLTLGSEDYASAGVNAHMLSLVRDAWAQGWVVTIATGRREEHRAVTEAWLAWNRVPYHFLFMGKPSCTYRIDDRNRSPREVRELLTTGKDPVDEGAWRSGL